MRRRDDVLAFLVGSTAVVALGWEDGGYYPRAWQWGSLAALVIVIAALVAGRRLELSGDEWGVLAALAGFAAWIAVTVAATDHSATLGIPELERTVLYLAVFSAAAVLPGTRSLSALPAGVLAGTVVMSAVGLASFLFPDTHQAPDVFEGRNLFQPIGYANAFGILVGIGALLALGFASGSRSRAARALAAGSLVPLLATLALTSSQGAVAAVALGFATMLVLDSRRRHLLLTLAKTLPLPVFAIVIAKHSRVADSHIAMTLVARDGRIVALAIAGLTVAAYVAGSFTLAEETRKPRVHAAVWIAAGIAAFAGTALAATRLHGALDDRPQYWHAAWLDVIHHPLVGSGAGSFATAWLRYRTIDSTVQDAHNLYLETLAELGPAGLFLLVVALAIPLRCVRGIDAPIAGSVCGAYVAFLAHSSIDWDWEMPVVTVAALLCAATLLHAQRSTRVAKATHRRRIAATAAVTAACIALLALTAAALAGSRALHEASENLRSKAWLKAASSARTAARWQPWSAEPYDLLGQAQVARGQRQAAAESFRHALRLDDQRWQTWYELGRIGSRKERQVALERIFVLNPRAVRTTRK